MKKKTSICLSLFITCAFAISSLLPLSTIWTTAKAESLSNINPDSGQPEIFVGDLGEFFNASSDISLSDASLSDTESEISTTNADNYNIVSYNYSDKSTI